MSEETTLNLMRKYAALRDAREREFGPVTEAMKAEEARSSALTAMALAGHPVHAEAARAVPAAVAA